MVKGPVLLQENHWVRIEINVYGEIHNTLASLITIEVEYLKFPTVEEYWQHPLRL